VASFLLYRSTVVTKNMIDAASYSDFSHSAGQVIRALIHIGNHSEGAMHDGASVCLEVC
jgi:hypothetical protein